MLCLFGGRIIDTAAAAYFEYLEKLSNLLRDPLFYGHGVEHGDGEPVLLIPGFLAGDWLMVTLARWLNRIGYRAHTSGIELNLGCPRETLEKLLWRVDFIARECESPVIIIGHSLGGVLGRMLGSIARDKVRYTIAIGAPIHGEWDAVRSHVRPILEGILTLWRCFANAPRECATTTCPCGIAASIGPHAPALENFTSIFTREDEIVDWRACLDPNGNNIEVRGRHLGLIVNPSVYKVVAELLTRQRARSETGADPSASDLYPVDF